MKLSFSKKNSCWLMAMAFSALFAFPFIWMVFASFKSNPEIFKPFPILPENYSLDYYRQLSDSQTPFLTLFINSCIVSLFQSLGAVACTVLAAYAFVRFEFKFKNLLFLLALISLVLPRQVLLIPLFEWMSFLSLTDHLLSLILPGLASGLGLLYFIQILKKIPDDLLDLARMEGANHLQTLLLILPTIQPALFTYGILHWVLCWQEHLLPMILIQSENKMTLSLGLSMLYSRSLTTDYAVLMAGSVFTILPVVLLFIWQMKNVQISLKWLMSSSEK